MQRRFLPMRLLLAAVMLLLPLGAAAQDEDDLLDEPVEEIDEEEVFTGPREPDWIPSLKVGIVVNTQFADGLVESIGIDNFTGTPAFFSSSGDTPIDGPAISAAFELMGPPVLPLDSRPFLQVGLRDQLEGAGSVARDQTSGNLANARVRLILEQEQRRMYQVGVGMAVPLPFDDWDIKLKPSLNYTRIDGEIAGVIIQPLLVDSNTSDPDFLTRESVDFVNHGIAPRLELDTEVFRQGPISVGLFFELETIILFGDLEEEIFVDSCFALTSCNVVIDPATGRGTAGYSRNVLERNRVIIQGGMGVRVSWMGY